MSAASIEVETVEDAGLVWLVGIAVASTTGAGSSNAPRTQAPASAAPPPRREAAASAASGFAVDASRPVRSGTAASGRFVDSGELTPSL